MELQPFRCQENARQLEATRPSTASLIIFPKARLSAQRNSLKISKPCQPAGFSPMQSTASTTIRQASTLSKAPPAPPSGRPAFIPLNPMSAGISSCCRFHPSVSAQAQETPPAVHIAMERIFLQNHCCCKALRWNHQQGSSCQQPIPPANAIQKKVLMTVLAELHCPTIQNDS